MSKQSYEFTGAKKVNAWGVTVKQIRATRKIPRHGVRKGDVGGWIESAELANGSARVAAEAWVSDNAQVFGNAQLFGHARVADNAQVFEDALVSGDAWVSGNAQVYGDAQVFGGAYVSGNALVSGSAYVSGNALVSDSARVYGDARVFGDARVSYSAQVFGDARVSGSARVYGDAQVSGNARVCGNAQVSGNARLCGDVRVERTNHYTIAGAMGSENVHDTFARGKGGGPNTAHRGVNDPGGRIMTVDLDALEAEYGDYAATEEVKTVRALIAELRQERERADENQKALDGTFRQAVAWGKERDRYRAALSRAEETIEKALAWMDAGGGRLGGHGDHPLRRILAEHDKQKGARAEGLHAAGFRRPVQAEPTDAQVLAALNAQNPYSQTGVLAHYSGDSIAYMRAALRAAFKAGGEGR